MIQDYINAFGITCNICNLNWPMDEFCPNCKYCPVCCPAEECPTAPYILRQREEAAREQLDADQEDGVRPD